MAEPRDFSSVVDRVLAEVPQNAAARPDLEAALKHLKEKALYTPPEMMRPIWVAMCLVLNKHLGPIDQPWKKAVDDVVSGRNEPA